MNKGRSCAEFRLSNSMTSAVEMMVGVGRPTLDVYKADPNEGTDFWGVFFSDSNSPLECDMGTVFHDGRTTYCVENWNAEMDRLEEKWRSGDQIRMLLDSDAGTLTVKVNGHLLGVLVKSGLTGDLCWTVCFGPYQEAPVAISMLDPKAF
jgi:hypothetical protein